MIDENDPKGGAVFWGLVILMIIAAILLIIFL